MKLRPLIALAGVVCMVVSCKQANPPERTKTAVSYSTPGAQWQESDFTPWMSRAELQFKQENNPADQYFANVEGRDNAGRIEYRAAIRPFPVDQYDQWAVFWGINETELFDWELRLLKTGFARKDTQVFADATGKTFYQIVWLKSKAQPEDPEKIADTSAPLIAGQSTLSNQPAPLEPQVADSPENGLVEVPVPETPATIEHHEEAVIAREPTQKPAAVPPAAPKAKPVKETADLPKKQFGKTTTYVVKPGDTLSKVSKIKGVSVSTLKECNGMKSDNLRIGQKLAIPVKGKS